jgi:hypothetical protein
VAWATGGGVTAAEGRAPSGAASPLARGPAEIRDGHLIAQGRLTLPALSAATTAAGRWSVRTGLLWSNSFSWTQDVPGETPEDRRFLMDGETATLDLVLRRGLSADLDVGVRVPVHGRGGGSLDALIDAWHRLLNLPDGERPLFQRDAFRIEGRTTAGRAFSWNERTGWGLGGIELEVRWRVATDGSGPSVALVGRALLPTGSGPWAGGGFGAAAQAVVDVPLGARVFLFSGLGVTAQDSTPVRGIAYEPVRLHGYAALEWRVAGPLSLLLETNVASRLVSNIDRYPGTHWLLNVGGRLDLGRRTCLDLLLTENIVSQQSTTDFALYLGVAVRP